MMLKVASRNKSPEKSVKQRLSSLIVAAVLLSLEILVCRFEDSGRCVG
jgi:hypothetical protein